MKDSEKRRKPSNVPHASNRRVSIPQDSHFVILREVINLLADYLPSTIEHIAKRAIRSCDVDFYNVEGDRIHPQGIGGTYDISVPEFRARYIVASFLKKYQPTVSTSNQVAAAFSAVRSGEMSCSRFNQTGRKAVNTEDSVFRRIRVLCSKILGPFDVDTLLSSACRHGPGSSTTCSFKKTSSYFKYGDYPYRVSSRAITHARSYIDSDKRWMRYLESEFRKRNSLEPDALIPAHQFWNDLFLADDQNHVTTVPKDYSKNRPIAIEHSLNIFLQLGVDGHIRRRLRYWGIDLNSQDLNRSLALRGTVDDSVHRPCTVDLANASDTVSLGVAKLILPPEWYSYLCDLRSVSGVTKDSRFSDCLRSRYSKLSSMGNGYTFAVESLIFFCIARATSEEYFGTRSGFPCAVFGDDIIVAEPVYEQLIYWLSHLGFSVNRRKSFAYGQFKESCGCDYYLGTNVRPVYLRKELKEETDIYSIRNRLNRWFSLNFPEIDLTSLDRIFSGWIRGDLLVGPYSDTEFDSYWHTKNPPVWSKFTYSPGNSNYRFSSLVSRVRKAEGENFFLRCLMATLRPRIRCQWDMSPQSGSVFDIIDRTVRIRQRGRRHVPWWNDAYSRLAAPRRQNVARTSQLR